MSTFEGTCKRKLACPSRQSCQLGREASEYAYKHKGEIQSFMCEWHSSSADHGYCAWNVINEATPIDDISEIARLNSISISDVKQILSTAPTKLKTLNSKESLMAMMSDYTDTDTLSYFDNHDLYHSDSILSKNFDEFSKTQEVVLKEQSDLSKSLDGRKKKKIVLTGTGGLHYKGNKVQLVGWNREHQKVVAGWAKAGTGIKIAPNNQKDEE